MKERPILFSAPMVRALLAGTKTQTRRAVKGCEFVADTADGVEPYWRLKDHPRKLVSGGTPMGPHVSVLCPYGQPGDRLWVRETHAIVPRTAYRCSEGVQQTMRPDDDHDAAIYREGWTRSNGGITWRPSIHMPRWASRITLEVTDVRVERAQDISEADAMAEGIVAVADGYGLPDGSHFHAADPRISYWSLLDHINGPGFVESNPWLWAVSFRRITP